MHPLAKFICVKSVVFFSWYQAFFIGCAVEFGWLPDRDEGGSTYGTNLQNFLICVEMFIAAIIHHYVFSHQGEYLSVGEEPEHVPIRKSWRTGLKAMMYVDDIKDDAKDMRNDIHRSLVTQAKATTNLSLPRRSKQTEPRTVDVV